jgi:transcriptional regulator with XRE-family HTH domain
MTIAETLEYYLNLLGCSAQELSEASAVSPATVSRYCSGAHSPKPGNKSIEKIAKGIAELSRRQDLRLSEEAVLHELQESCRLPADIGSLLAANFNILVNRLNISLTALSEFSNFHLSYLYRIRNGERKPHKTDNLRDSICKILAR